MIIQKKELSIDDFAEHAGTDDIIFSDSEAEILKRVIPNTFSDHPWNRLVKNGHEELEANQAVFGNFVTISISIARGSNLEKLKKKKTTYLNRILSAFGCQTVVPNKDHFFQLYTITRKSLEFMNMTTPNICFPQITRKTHQDYFPDVKDELNSFFPDAPKIIYGSSINFLTNKNLNSENKPEDIDTAVIHDEFSPEVYKKIFNKYDKTKELPISFVVIPKEYLDAFVMSDNNDTFFYGKSMLIESSISIPNISEEYIRNLGFYKAMLDYFDTRNALAKTEIEESENIVPIMNNKLKKIKFIHKSLTSMSKLELPGFTVEQFDPKLPPPPIQEYVDCLIDTNAQLYDTMKTYLSINK